MHPDTGRAAIERAELKALREYINKHRAIERALMQANDHGGYLVRSCGLSSRAGIWPHGRVICKRREATCVPVYHAPARPAATKELTYERLPETA